MYANNYFSTRKVSPISKLDSMRLIFLFGANGMNRYEQVIILVFADFFSKNKEFNTDSVLYTNKS